MSFVIYPGSFDPITLGHVDVLERGLKIYGKVVMAVAKNPEKKPLFSLEERMGMIREATKDLKGVEVDSFGGLLVDYAKSRGASVVLRGLRALSDFEYEFQMALTNRKLRPQMETIFMMPSETQAYVSSRGIKEIASLGGNISDFVPSGVAKCLKEKMGAK